MLTLLRNADVFAPEPLGRCDLLVAGPRIAWIGRGLAGLPAALDAVEVDLGGRPLVPGLIDAHVHVTGGGGESGPSTRVPPVTLTALTTAGVTSVVGVLGTDGTTRTMRDLVARILGLREEGLSAWCYTGSYEVPPVTLTGRVRDDIVFVDPVIGLGEVAISDHRSSQPTHDELARLAADCHVAGLMTGKAGVLHLHLGDGARGLSPVRALLEATELPARVFHPTHVNRQRRLWEEAREIAQRGVTVDVTASGDDGDSVPAAVAIAEALDGALPPGRLTVSSDGCGCLPTFGPDGRMVAMDIGRSSALAVTLSALLEEGWPLEDVIRPFTSNVAELLRLPRKGRIAAGADADLVVLGPGSRPADVMARGRWMVRDGRPVVAGTFERGEQPAE